MCEKCAQKPRPTGRREEKVFAFNFLLCFFFDAQMCRSGGSTTIERRTMMRRVPTMKQQKKEGKKKTKKSAIIYDSFIQKGKQAGRQAKKFFHSISSEWVIKYCCWYRPQQQQYIVERTIAAWYYGERMEKKE